VVRGFSQEQMDRAIEAITAAGRKMKLV